MVIDEEKAALFNIVKLKLNGGVKKFEITDEAMCALLELAVGNYAEKVQNFIIEGNWASMYGKQLSNLDLAYAMSVRTLDMTKDYSYYFSKEVGLQSRGTKFELKKDFINLECGKQVYVIPKGREINKVLWITPPVTDSALFANYGGFGVSFGGGVMGQMGLGAATVFGGMGNAYGMGAGIWALPMMDVSLMAADLKYKQGFFKSDLTYKVTAGPDGTHLLHLMSTPGSKLTFGYAGKGLYSLNGCTCWYTYYDTDENNADECRRENPDVLLTPDQVPLAKMEYSYFNKPTKVLIRQFLIGEAAETLGLTRGKFSGVINMLANTLTMDYNMLISLGQREKDKANETLEKRLERLSPYNVMEKQKELVENLIATKKGTPLGFYVK